MSDYEIAPPGVEPPDEAIWRNILDHWRDGERCPGWVALSTQPAAIHGIAQIPDGSVVYLVPSEFGRIWPDPIWPGPEAPRPGEWYGSWRRRSPRLRTGFESKKAAVQSGGREDG